MTRDSSNSNFNNKKKKRVLLIIIVIFLIFLLLLLLIGLYFYFKGKNKIVIPAKGTEVINKDSLAGKTETKPLKIDTAKPKSKRIDSIRPKPKKLPQFTKKARPVAEDTVFRDTTTYETIVPDTVVYDPCTDDTLPPWVYPDPSGGLHYGKIVVHFVVSKPCSILWRFNEEEVWRYYSIGSDSIGIAQNTILCYKAKDSCGNTMDTRYEHYEIAMSQKQKFCPEDMEYIVSGGEQFCIDRYEWPNKKNYKPKSNISIYHAMDSCFKVGKRLCTTEEWSFACSGVHNWKYTYGDNYEPNACVTKDTSVQLTGKRPECRGYFQVFDMSGNLAEWTNTKSAKNKSFYNVMGGFWESGPQSTCTDARYSYYPTNTHNPVGFRCCKEENAVDKNSK